MQSQSREEGRDCDVCCEHPVLVACEGGDSFAINRWTVEEKRCGARYQRHSKGAESELPMACEVEKQRPECGRRFDCHQQTDCDGCGQLATFLKKHRSQCGKKK